MELQVTYR